MYEAVRFILLLKSLGHETYRRAEADRATLARLAAYNAGQAVGFSVVGGIAHPTGWSGGNVISLAGLPGSKGALL
jgi:hypothetical protein